MARRLRLQLGECVSRRASLATWNATTEGGRRVALTMVEEKAPRFAREQLERVARSLVGQRIRGVLGVQTVEDGAFVSDGWSEGTALDVPLFEWSFERRLAFGRQVVAALAALHEIGVVHGCLTPRNVLLDDALHPVLADVGLVAVGAELGGDPINTFGYGAYASPEARAPGPLDARTDVYSAGKLLAWLLSKPARMRADERPPEVASLDHLPANLLAILARCVGSDRYPSARELLRELERAGFATVSTRASAPPSRRLRASSKLMLIVAAVLLVAGGALLWTSGSLRVAPAELERKESLEAP